jgi:hypothetical protein
LLSAGKVVFRESGNRGVPVTRSIQQQSQYFNNRDKSLRSLLWEVFDNWFKDVENASGDKVKPIRALEATCV